MKNIIAALLFLLAGLTPASAQDNSGLAAIEARQAIMSYIGSNMRPMSAMMQGRSDFDAEFVQSTGRAIHAMSKALKLLFPDGSEEGLDTKALPSLFTSRGDFLEKLQALESGAVGLANAETLDMFQAAFPALGGACKSCHSQYRSE